MKGRLYTAADIAELAAAAREQRLVLGRADRITPLALDRARELGVEIVYGDGEVAGLPTWSGAALQERRRNAARSPLPRQPSPDPPPSLSAAPSDLEARVREAVLRALGQSPPPLASSSASAGSRLVHVQGEDLSLPPSPEAPYEDVQLRNLIGRAQGSPMTAGFMTLRAGEFPRHIADDEIEFIIEGELHIGTEQGVRVAQAGDVIFLPKGGDVTFGTPQWAKILYVRYPARSPG